MDTVTLVENQIDDGQRLLNRLGEEGFVVRAACWVKPVEEDRWSLYIATPAVDEKGIAQAYRQVYRVLRSLKGVLITDSDIKLVGEKHSVAEAALAATKPNVPNSPYAVRNPSPYPGMTRYSGSTLGGVSIDGALIYPPTQPA